MSNARGPITVHYWPTPNGHKITIMLEELGAPYELAFVNIAKGDQFKPEFLAISPNNKMPAITDPDGPGGTPISIFESGAILMYLGSKFGKFYPQDERARIEVHEWLMWQMGSFGPMLGQRGHFAVYAKDKIPYAIERYQNETHRLYGVLDKRLAAHEYVAGEYSIADMAIYPWSAGWYSQGLDTAEFPNVKRWRDSIAARPAVAKAMAIKAPTPAVDLANDEEARKVLFGQRAR
jgi:GSH-dependent disulfide-bond oxidoreductase